MNFKLYVAGIVAALAVGFGVAWRWKPMPPPVVQTVVQEKVVERIVTKTVTKTIKPDGTVIETTKEQAKDKATETQEKKADPKQAAVFHPDPTWSLGLGVRAEVQDPFRALSYTFEVGRRVSGPWWLDAGFDVRERHIEAVTVGVRVVW